MSSYANLALLLGSIGRPGRVFGRQGGHQSAYMYDFDWPHPAKGDDRRNLWQELEKGTIDVLIFAVCNPLRMQQQTTQLRQFAERVPFIVDVNMRPQDTTTTPTSSCRPPPGASTPTRARTSSGACASTRSSTTAPARSSPST